MAKPVPKPEPQVAADSPSASADEKSKTDTKKPLAKPDAKIAAVKKEAKPAAPKTVATTPSSAMSSISSLLDSINARKPDPVVAAASKEDKQSHPSETAEQRAKRLHKEARRKLRVSWKPEGELVQMKIFEKDDEEDEGRDVNMTRDAADDRSEGMMLKRRADVGMEDDDDDLPYQPWVTPVATDFSVLPDSIRKKSYVTRGGERRVQHRRAEAHCRTGPARAHGHLSGPGRHTTNTQVAAPRRRMCQGHRRNLATCPKKTLGSKRSSFDGRKSSRWDGTRPWLQH